MKELGHMKPINWNYKKLKSANHDGVKFAVKYVKSGEDRWHKDSAHYKMYGGVPNEYKESIVQIYDLRYDDDNPEGQFVSSYSVSTILKHDPCCGLSLYLDIPSWNLTARQVREMQTFARQELNLETITF
tara:strand:+ start:790 stop:1179 length:390 start_codon:yes stop_codon:yes gene_type:complete